MEKQIKTIEVSISKKKDGITVKNNLGLEWSFPDTMTAHDALVLLISKTMNLQFDLQSEFRNTFTIEMTVK